MAYEQLATKVEQRHQSALERKRCFIGFDGFTDQIISVVDQRSDPYSYSPIPEIAGFSQRIAEAAGHSGNFELVPIRCKIGGNAPILCAALVPGTHKVTLCGAVGSNGEIEAVFSELAERCDAVIPIAASGQSQALEFQDGKIILGQLQSVSQIDYSAVASHTSLKDEIEHCDLFACVNWTMIMGMNGIWQHILDEVAPKLSKREEGRWMFVDLADPAKRSDSDLLEAVNLLSQLNQHFNVILGLNTSEAKRLGDVLDCPLALESPQALQTSALALCHIIGISDILIHATAFAANASSSATGPYCANPTLTTGAGDNFNGGYCNALLFGLSPAECLLTAVATSGFYVRNGRSPEMAELTDFIREWPSD